MDTETLATLASAGRIMLASLFVIGGVRHFFGFSEIAAAIAARGVPMASAALLVGTLFEISMGVLLMVGLHPALAALGLVAFTLAASFLMLNFWSLAGAERAAAQNVWLSNIAIVGGLLLAAAHYANI